MTSEEQAEKLRQLEAELVQILYTVTDTSYVVPMVARCRKLVAELYAPLVR